MVVVAVTIDALAGATAMLTNGELVTVTVAAGEVTPFNAAVTVVVPTVLPVTTPVLLPMLAVAGAAEVQVAEVVMSAVEPLE